MVSFKDCRTILLKSLVVEICQSLNDWVSLPLAIENADEVKVGLIETRLAPLAGDVMLGALAAGGIIVVNDEVGLQSL